MMDDQAPLLGRGGHARSYRHRVPRSKTVTHLALAAVLVTETFERIAFYGVVGSLVLFLNGSPFNWSSYNATNALFMFTGVSYMSSIVSGWLADSCCGKFKTIIFAFCIYIAGFVFFPLLIPDVHVRQNVTHPPNWCSWPAKGRDNNGTNIEHLLKSSDVYTDVDKSMRWYPLSPVSVLTESCSWAVYLALIIMGLGTGAVKANISPFGGDQVKHDGPAAIRMFVNWFYWCINLGTLISLGGLAYIQQEVSFFWGYVAPNISLVIALSTFIMGGCVYVKHPAGGSILTNIVKILHESCQKAFCVRRPTTYGLVRGSPLAFREAPACCLDYAKIQYGGSYHDNMVDDVKKLGKICLVFIAMIPYWIVYFQMETTFVLQGLHMRLDLTGNGTKTSAAERTFKFPVAWLSLFDAVFLILLIPLFDRVIYPALDHHGYMLSPRLRIMIGMILSMCAVACAGFLEIYRLDVYWKNCTENIHWQIVGDTYYRAANVSILLQIPQYALIGIGEVFASIAGLEIAYVLAPRTMQGLITGIFWFTQGLGAMLGSGILQSFRGVWFFPWDYGDINCYRLPCPTQTDPDAKCNCHLDYYFFFLSGLQLVGIIAFALIAWVLDMGLHSIYSRNNSTLEDSLSPSGITEESDRSHLTPGGSTRPGYRTFISKPNVPYRAVRDTSETDTLDTDYNSDHR